MATNNGQSDWNDIIEPGGSGTSGRDSLPSRRAARAAAGGDAYREGGPGSGGGKEGPNEKYHPGGKRRGRIACIPEGCQGLVGR